MNKKFITLTHVALIIGLIHSPSWGALEYMAPGTLRVTSDLQLEGILHAPRRGYTVTENGVNKSYAVTGNSQKAWKAEWGQRLLTHVGTQMTESIRGRMLFEVQGEYADRFWRPVNIEHRAARRSEHVFIREAEGRIDQQNWYLHAFSGVEHADWQAHGDFFALYPSAYPTINYLGSSVYYGVYPARANQNHFRNIADRIAPQGAELGARWLGIESAVAYGSELQWGFQDSVFGRVSFPLWGSKLTFVGQNKDAPFANDEDEHDEAYSLTWERPFGKGHLFKVGSLYRPFRSGERYVTADPVALGSGVLGSGWSLGEKRSKKEDGFGYRARLEVQPEYWGRLWNYAVDLTHLGILAGNKNQIDLDAGTHLSSLIRFDGRYTYRKPVEGPVPFLFEGTPDNIGAVVASPRGRESPFAVDWTNREAVFVLGTFQLNPTEYSNMFLYDPHTLARWNVNQKKTQTYSLAAQYRMSDYRTATDRQWFYDENGKIQYESAASRGAWATDHPLHEFRVMGMAQIYDWNVFLGVAGGQTPALSGLAYTSADGSNKSLTEYFSLEGELTHGRISVRGHYGSGVWGPEPHNDPFFGESFDRLWGWGGSVKITKHTAWDIDYLAARQDDNQFVAPDLGSYDEIRTVLSHRFGFELMFKE